MAVTPRRWPVAAPLVAALVLGLAGAGVAALSSEQVAREAGLIAELLELAPGRTVADVGAGNGRFSVHLARVVGEQGRVFATEVDERDLEDLRERVEEAGLTNVTVVAGTQEDTGLPAACCDAILLRRVYHHFTDPPAMRADLLRALRPGGVIAVIDFVPNDWKPPKGVPDRGGHGVRAEEVVREMIDDGFELVRRVEGWQGEGDDYCLLFRRPPHRRPRFLP